MNDNVVAVQGWIQDTLRKFLSEKNPKVNFVHIDVDTYDFEDSKENLSYVIDKINAEINGLF